MVATVCALAIVTTYRGTLDAANANRRIALERAVFKVIPGAVRIEPMFATAAGLVLANGKPSAETAPFHAAYGADGTLKGIAAEGAAKGYADTVRVLYAYDPAREAITGFGVVFTRETPGIGDKISSDAAFLSNFDALDARLASDLKALANAIKTVKHGSKKEPWEIDAIAGATITAKAVGRGINDSAQRLIPLLRPQLEQLR
ncbi:MAG: FMN-binding protein [Thiotrichales bacterium]